MPYIKVSNSDKWLGYIRLPKAKKEEEADIQSLIKHCVDKGVSKPPMSKATLIDMIESAHHDKASISAYQAIREKSTELTMHIDYSAILKDLLNPPVLTFISFRWVVENKLTIDTLPVQEPID